MANMSYNPVLTSNALGSFSTTSDGYVQGVALDDPSVRNLLAGGYLASTETLPMWGGVAISENIPGASFDGSLGGAVGRATTTANITGFSVINQAHNWVTTPQSEAPSAGSGMTIPFYRLGSNARIAVQIDPSLVSLDGSLITQQVSWDLNQQRLVPYQPLEAANVITAMSWASTSGGTVTVTTTSAHGLVPGNDFTISGAVPAAYNGDWTAIAGTTGSTIVFLLPAASTPGTVTTFGQVNAGGGALNVRILHLNIGNSKVVSYDAVNNLVHWNNSGSTAIILI